MKNEQIYTTGPAQPPLTLDKLQEIVKEFEKTVGPPPQSEYRVTREEYEAIKNHPDVVVSDRPLSSLEMLTGVRITAFDEVSTLTPEMIDWLTTEMRKCLTFPFRLE